MQLRSVRPADIEYRRDTSGFVDYGLNWTSTGERLVGLEAGLSLGPGLFSSYFTSSHTLGNLRGPTSVTFDRREQMQRWIAGDAVAATGTLGASMPIAGVDHLARLRSRSLFHPLPHRGPERLTDGAGDA